MTLHILIGKHHTMNHEKTPSLYPEYLLNLMVPIESIHIMNGKSLSRCVEDTMEVTLVRRVAVSVNIAPPRASDSPIMPPEVFRVWDNSHF
jgi:hypothetical protein